MTSSLCKTFVRGLLFAVAVLSQLGVAQAVPLLGGPIGLVSPTNVITFDELGNLQNQAITTQFASFGATFQTAWWDNATQGQAGSIGFAGGDLIAGSTPGVVGGTGIGINFTTTVTDAAFAAVDQGGLFTLTSFLNDVVVETFTIAIPFNPGIGFIGFTNSLFDEITIIPATGSALTIDTLQFNVPTPATLGLLLLALAGLGATTRIRRSG